jgi:hypothetical protein
VDWARDFWHKMDLLKDEKSGQWLDGADGEPINNWKRYTSGALTKERKQQVKDEREEEEELVHD